MATEAQIIAVEDQLRDAGWKMTSFLRWEDPVTAIESCTEVAWETHCQRLARNAAKPTGWLVKSNAENRTMFGVLLPGQHMIWFDSSFYQAARYLLTLVHASVCERQPRFAALFG